MTMTLQHTNEIAMFDNKNIQLLKDTICKGSSEEEFQLFLHACKRTGLDPFMRQIYAVKRWDGNLRRESMTIQTGIDGYRLIADRTGNYAPGKEPTFTYDKDGNLFSCTSYVKKRTSDGTWHEVSATAHFKEYVCTLKDGSPNNMWKTKGHIMLSKCAEALSLRKAFPAELSGIYTKEEMEQADNVVVTTIKSKDELIESTQADEIQRLLMECDPEYMHAVMSALKNQNIESFSQLTTPLYERIKKAALVKRAEYIAKSVSAVQEEEVLN